MEQSDRPRRSLALALLVAFALPAAPTAAKPVFDTLPASLTPASTTHGFPDPPSLSRVSPAPTEAASADARPRPPREGRSPPLDAAFLDAFDALFEPRGRTDEPLLGAAVADSGDTVGAFEEQRRRLARHGAWLDAHAPTTNARQLIERIADIGAHGLDPSRYDLDGLREGVAALFDPQPPRIPVEFAFDSPAHAALVYRFDRAFSRLARDLGRGIVDARATQAELYRDVPVVDIASLREALAFGTLDVDAALDSVAPTHERYLRLVDTTRKLLAEQAAGIVRTRVDEDTVLEAGAHDPDVMRIKRRLVETGEFPGGTAITPIFDSELVLALEAFRARNGLPPALTVDRHERDALNVDIEDELDALALSLERWRWMPRTLGERHVFVNLPNYRLTYHDGARRVIDMPVVIGALEHQTPSFSRDMSYLEFNPSWTVPPKIAYRELLPIERRRPGYLASRNFDYMKVVNGQLEKVAHESVSRSDLDLRPFPYYLRQRGGPGNALGRMKFMMPNVHAIYLHDTQAKRHFALHERAYSHGCIRLGDPDLLARTVLQLDGLSLGAAEALIGSRTTRRARLKQPLPTHLAYFTTWVDPYGALQRRADVYGHDEALRTALRANGALPSARLGVTAGAPG